MLSFVVACNSNKSEEEMDDLGLKHKPDSQSSIDQNKFNSAIDMDLAMRC